MSRTRFAQLPEVFKTLIITTQEAYAPLKDVDEIGKEEDLAPFNQARGVEDFKNNPENYEANCSKILDFFLLKMPDILDVIIEENYSGMGGTPRTIAAVVLRAKQYINPAAFYLDNNVACVPHITSERLYKKMQWMEWLLTKIKAKSSTLSWPIRKALDTFIDKRLPSTIKRIDEYAAKNSLKRISVYDLEAHSKQLQAEQHSTAAITSATVSLQEHKRDKVEEQLTQMEVTSGAQVEITEDAKLDLSLSEDESDDDEEFFDAKEYEDVDKRSAQSMQAAKEDIQNLRREVFLSAVLSNDTSDDEDEDDFKEARELPPEHKIVEASSIDNPNAVQPDMCVLPNSMFSVTERKELKEAPFQQEKNNVRMIINEHLLRVHDPRVKLYVKETVNRRAAELLAEVDSSNSKKDLENIIIRFILTGQTKSDNLK